MTLREKVDKLLPGWENWYPSLFAAAQDLGVIRARVCPPSSLLLSNRHSRIQQVAKDAHRDQWGGNTQELVVREGEKLKRKRRRKRRRKAAPPTT